MERTIRDGKFDEKWLDKRLTVELGGELHRAGRLNPYGYRFIGVFTFESEEKEDFIEFVTLALGEGCPNILVITDDKLNYLRKSGSFDRSVLTKYAIEEQSVLIQPFELTEQILKLLFIPLASKIKGAVVFTTFYSPVLRINGLKAGFRRLMKGKNRNATFSDDDLDELVEFLGIERARSENPVVRKLYNIITLVTDPSVFPMLSGYIDYAGLYGASQLLRLHEELLCEN